MTDTDLVATLLDDYGETYAEQAGIRIADKPSPLYRLSVLALLLSGRIRADIAVDAARELASAGMRTAKAMRTASWQQRVDALGRGGYRRFDERTSTMLGDGADLLLERYRGDLRRLRESADHDPKRVRELLREIPGIGPNGAEIFCREAQGLWAELAPTVDSKALDGAEAIGLPKRPEQLADLVEPARLPNLAAALVRVGLDKDAATSVREHARHR